jgi:hypothetical protein
VETRDRGPRRELLEEVKAKRGSTIGHWLIPARCERISRMHQSLEPAQERPFSPSPSGGGWKRCNGKRGKAR